MSLMNMLGVITHPLPGRRGGNTGNTIKHLSPATLLALCILFIQFSSYYSAAQ